MISVRHARDLAPFAGSSLGKSDWLTVDQTMVDAFATLTGDTHWIHTDTERASRNLPGGTTIAHGLLLLSLMPRLQREIYEIAERGAGLNYGYDRVRFILPVPVGTQVRLSLSLVSADLHAQGTRIQTDAVIEIGQEAQPAVVARHILLVRDMINGD